MLQGIINTFALGSIYLLFSLGLGLTWGTIGVLNFAHGATFMFSAFIAYLIVRDTRLPMLPLLVIGLLVGALVAILAQLLAFQPILQRSKDLQQAELQILIGGIGLAGIPLAIAQKVTKSNPFGYSDSSFQVHTYTLFGARISNAQIIIIVISLALGIAMTLWIRKSRAGLALRSIGVDPEVSSLMGISRTRLSIWTMAFAGALAGLAGVLLTFNLGAIAPETGDSFLLKGFAAIMLGGVGSMLGVIIGAGVLAAAETVILTQTSGTWVDAVSFGLIFIVLLVRPRGLFGRREVRRT